MRNSVLQCLQPADAQWLRSRSKSVKLSLNTSLYGEGGEIDFVYFPESGLVSLLNAAQKADLVEVGFVGREGIVGGEILLGSNWRAIEPTVQMSGEAIQVPAEIFLDACNTVPALRRA